MKTLSLYMLIISIFALGCNAEEQKATPKEGYNKLTAEEEYIIVKKGTESRDSGKYNKFYEKGIYSCKRCNEALFESDSKFNSKSGWPSFDTNISDAVKKNADGTRTEIVCNNCDGHLGHVFYGEKFTKNNTRHCVNSLSMTFTEAKNIETAIFASGCFWGTEHWMYKAKGVISTSCGYLGGKSKNPTYEQVCSGLTGHAEAVEVIFDKTKTDYETLCKLFFETHNPSQVNGQGPDIGTQYRSVVFYTTPEQKTITEKLIKTLKGSGTKIATKVTQASTFYDAEENHQNYYKKNKKKPYCHKYVKRF
jgi:peptide methionine sulfoxide reductase msrA/msrB